MPDRGRRTAIHLLPRDRRSTDDSNPFAPPPEGRPDQPWQPRRPDDDNDGGGGSGGDDGNGEGGREDRPSWGSRWSPRQPGRSSDGFGGGGSGGNGTQQGEPPRPGKQEGPQLRWDPTDPTQRRARYALLAGMWGFFFAVFDFPELALLLGALALYWGISSLRAGGGAAGRAAAAEDPAPSNAAGAAAKSQRTAAVSGLITASLALLIVAATFTVQLVYRDFYTCVDDALTKDGQLSCNELLPDPLEDWIGVKE
ncbi:hypothetical protein [Streptomyces sp. TRM49041]|uniref:hypothetical protein n=1 Tax=Streptomyces sp. TRM49041 TaxID=2603216 RepID=UPI0011ED05E0|nr:hypothetical protein [Streptomyces sp. TRM49041]